MMYSYFKAIKVAHAAFIFLMLSSLLYCHNNALAQDNKEHIVVRGAGASFPYPLYAWWALRYSKTHNTTIQYESIGSGGGIRQIKGEVVDFGATDAPLTVHELKQEGLVQF